MRRNAIGSHFGVKSHWNSSNVPEKESELNSFARITFALADTLATAALAILISLGIEEDWLLSPLK